MKYIRNPRLKYWMLCRRLPSGIIECLADNGAFGGTWSYTHGVMWFEAKSPAVCKKAAQKSKDHVPGSEVFIVRVNSKNCPIEVDFVNEAPRHTKGNVLFRFRAVQPIKWKKEHLYNNYIKIEED